MGQAEPVYRRVVIKLSGEALQNRETGEPFDPPVLESIARQLVEVHELGVEIAIVVGGGNIFRGLKGERRGVDRTTGDYMGMLSTVINGLAFMDVIEKMGVPVRVQSAIPVEKIAEPFILRRAKRHLEKGRIVIFVAGTGNPYFSTDTTAALRASEIGADIILKATNVDGVYEKDPKTHPDAKKYDRVTFLEALRKRLKVMDSTAFSLCLDNKMPILVFAMHDEASIRRVVCGEAIGTVVTADE